MPRRQEGSHVHVHAGSGVGEDEQVTGEAAGGGAPFARHRLDIGEALGQCGDADSMLGLLTHERQRMSFTDIVSTFERIMTFGQAVKESKNGDKGASNESGGGGAGGRRSREHKASEKEKSAEREEQLLELLSDMSLLHRSQFDFAFCRLAMATLKKLKVKPKSAACAAFLQALCDELVLSLERCDGGDVSNLLMAFADLVPTVQPASSCEAVCARCKELVNSYSVEHVSDIVWSLSALQMGSNSGELVELLSARLLHLIGDNAQMRILRESKVLSDLMRAFATLQTTAGQVLAQQATHLLNALLSQVQQVQDWKAGHVVTILWSAATLNLTLPHSVLEFLGELTKTRLWMSYTSHNISNSFWAYATMKKVPDAQLVRDLTKRAVQVMSDFDLEYLKNMLWALATLKDGVQVDAQLLTRIYQHTCMLTRANVGQLTHSQVSSIMWSIATLEMDKRSGSIKVRPEARDVMIRMVMVLGGGHLVAHAPPQFLTSTLHSMASVEIWSMWADENDTTNVRRCKQDSHRDPLRNNEAVDKGKVDVIVAYAKRLREVIHTLEIVEVKTIMWAMRVLGVDAGGEEDDMLALLARHSAASTLDISTVVDIMWTHAVLWKQADTELLAVLQKYAAEGAASLTDLTSVTRLLWALAATHVQQAEQAEKRAELYTECALNWRTVLHELAVILLRDADKLGAHNLKHLHQFFLTCNTNVALLESLPDAMLDVKEKLEHQCMLLVREESGGTRLEHVLGETCAAQLRKAGLNVATEVECSNTAYNLDMLLTPASDTALGGVGGAYLEPPAGGLRGWVLEIDRPCHYLAGSRSLKIGRCKLREAHLQSVGYGVISLAYWEWAQVLELPDDELRAFLLAKLHAAFAAGTPQLQGCEGGM